jgi:putative membrane protein
MEGEDHMMMNMMGWGMVVNMVFWILIVGLVIYAILSVITKPFEKKKDQAVQILRERYAHGEITEEEWKQKREALTGK